MKTTRCISCACTENRACDDGLGGGCSWLTVDHEKGVGVCSACPRATDRWARGDRRVRGLFVLRRKGAGRATWLCDSTATLQQPNSTNEEKYARRYASRAVAAGIGKKLKGRLGARCRVDLTEVRT